MNKTDINTKLTNNHITPLRSTYMLCFVQLLFENESTRKIYINQTIIEELKTMRKTIVLSKNNSRMEKRASARTKNKNEKNKNHSLRKEAEERQENVRYKNLYVC